MVKWGILNGMPGRFYDEFLLFNEDPSRIKNLKIGKKRKSSFLEEFSEKKEEESAN